MFVILIIHIAAGGWWIGATLMDRMRPITAGIATLTSGLGLAIHTGQIGRSCISFMAMTAIVFAASRYRIARQSN